MAIILTQFHGILAGITWGICLSECVFPKIFLPPQREVACLGSWMSLGNFDKGWGRIGSYIFQVAFGAWAASLGITTFFTFPQSLS